MPRAVVFVHSNGEEGSSCIARVSSDGSSVSVTTFGSQDFGAETTEDLWTFPHEVTTVDAVEIANNTLFILVGLCNGEVVSCLFDLNNLQAKYVSTIGRLHSAVQLVNISKTGCIFASSVDGEATLFYLADDLSQFGAERNAGQSTRITVQLPATCLSANSWFTSPPPPSVPTCIIEILSAYGSVADTESEVAAFLQSYCAGWSPSDATASSSKECRVMLIGCADGTVWAVITPVASVVRQLSCLSEPKERESSSGVDEWKTEAAKKIEVVGGEVCKLFWAPAPNNSERMALWVVEEDGHCSVFSLQPSLQTSRTVTATGMHLRRQKQLNTFSLPSTADIHSVRMLGTVLVYVCRNTGALCACILTPTTAVCGGGGGGSSGGCNSGNELSVKSVTLTSHHMPYIKAFDIAVYAGGGDDSASASADGKGYLLLETSALGLQAVLFTVPDGCGRGDADAVIQALRAACGSNVSEVFVPIHAVVAGQPGKLASSHLTVHDSPQESVHKLGARFAAAHRTLADLQRQIKEQDCEALRLMALLNVLGDDRQGLQLHCSGGGGGGGGAWGERNNAWLQWSPPLRNRAQDLSLRHRLRVEPTETGSGVYLDLQLTASSLNGMRALQQRTAVVALEACAPLSSLHPGAMSHSTGITFQPHPQQAESGKDVRHPLPQYEWEATFLVTESMDRLCDYRLQLSVVVEGPDGEEEGGALLCLVDQVLPQSALQGCVEQSPAYRAAQRLHTMMKSAGQLTGEVKVSSAAAATISDTNPLRAAFLPAQGGAGGSGGSGGGGGSQGENC